MDTSNLWDYDDTPVSSYDVEVPRWIDQDITPATVAAIVQGGCASGAYMPAVTYHTALKTMNEREDEILQSIEDSWGEDPFKMIHGEVTSWAGLAVYFVSLAVELWASGVEQELSDILDALATAEEQTTL